MNGEEGRSVRRSALLRSLLELPVILLISFALVFGFVRPVVAAPFYVGSESMVPTLQVWDRLLINKLAYDIEGPERGDIILFRDPEGGEEPLIKRVVGFPGDQVAVRGGKLFLNGEPQKETYTNKKFPDRSFFAQTTVPKGHVFVMGDNRANSADSRVFGPLPEKNIEGEAFLCFWPPDRIGLL